ncbi:TetR family transcriptional regulator [Nocardioides albertanoniae]|uniref:TetR family transcriptional regulator n=2 Tax=Nocardioides TaxID=1839 RepID=A0A543A8J0_9ACTN|nr:MULTISPECIES: TetR/AcrR family transcriptional regulator [Nocardioides]NYI77100.1 AcrR family transcriptional regulator [Nocardioides panzhihuensis]TQL68849.1 TetR family transcriptional regulator [Nocardioides albertanoniae]
MSSAASNNRRPGPGRPRHIPASDTHADPRDQILAVSARLFVGQGYAGTSTRDIAEAVGIRQASLYYHFAGKPGILAELLEMTVRPALDRVGDLARIESPEAALYLLAFHDAESLATLMHNIGMLPACPDVSQTPEAREYAAARGQLREAYGSLGISCGSQAVTDTVAMLQLGELILNAVESVIGTRASGDTVTNKELHGVAVSSLRICGVPQAQIEVAAKVAVAAVGQMWLCQPDLGPR